MRWCNVSAPAAVRSTELSVCNAAALISCWAAAAPAASRARLSLASSSEAASPSIFSTAPRINWIACRVAPKRSTAVVQNTAAAATTASETPTMAHCVRRRKRSASPRSAVARARAPSSNACNSAFASRQSGVSSLFSRAKALAAAPARAIFSNSSCKAASRAMVRPACSNAVTGAVASPSAASRSRIPAWASCQDDHALARFSYALAFAGSNRMLRIACPICSPSATSVTQTDSSRPALSARAWSCMAWRSESHSAPSASSSTRQKQPNPQRSSPRSESLSALDDEGMAKRNQLPHRSIPRAT
jgi:hypothetical protein